MTEKIRLSLSAEGAPDWFLILPRGEVKLGDGRPPFTVTEASLTKILADFGDRGNDLVIDYEHQSLGGGEAPAAGWVKELLNAPPGLMARVEWTPRALEYLGGREYRYFSPVVELNADREVIGLVNAALTNVPAIANLPPLVAKLETNRAANPAKSKEIQMIERLRQVLGLAPEADETAVLAALGKQQAALDVLSEIGRALGLEDVSASKVKGAVLALKAGSDKLTVIETELTALRRERRQEKAAAAVESAVRTGKVVPAQREWALKYAGDDPDGFEAYVANAPVIVPVTDPGDSPARPGQGDALTADDLAICRATGVDPEAFKATRLAERRAKQEVA